MNIDGYFYVFLLATQRNTGNRMWKALNLVIRFDFDRTILRDNHRPTGFHFENN